MAGKLYVSRRLEGDGPSAQRLINDLRAEFTSNLFNLVAPTSGRVADAVREQIAEADALLVMLGEEFTRQRSPQFDDPILLAELEVAEELDKPVVFASFGDTTDRQPLAVEFLRDKVYSWLVHIRRESWTSDVRGLADTLRDVTGGSSSSPELPAPPTIPLQGYGPHFKFSEDGIIISVPPEELDTEGNDAAYLSKMHPGMRELAEELVKLLGHGNVPFSHLLSIAEKYVKEIDKPSYRDIDFARLHFAGVRLANAEQALGQDDDLPPLNVASKETLTSLLRMHGPFLRASREGGLVLAAEERYNRTPQQEREFQTSAQNIAAALEHYPKVIDPAVATIARDAAGEIGKGANPERSGVAAAGVFKNLTVVLASVASVGAFAAAAQGWPPAMFMAGGILLLNNEAVKASEPFIELRKIWTAGINLAGRADAQALLRKCTKLCRPALHLFKQIESSLRIVANGEDDQWLTDTADWIKALGSEPKWVKPERKEPKFGPPPRRREEPHPLEGVIYLAKVTQVDAGMQSAILDLGDQQGVVKFQNIHPDYYQIPVADRQQLIESVGDPTQKFKINEVIKRRQIMLVQVMGQPRSAQLVALTSYMMLPGQYLGLFPNGENRPIIQLRSDWNAFSSDQKIPIGLAEPDGMAVELFRGAHLATLQQLQHELDQLYARWEHVRDLTLKSAAPTLVYEPPRDMIDRA